MGNHLLNYPKSAPLTEPKRKLKRGTTKKGKKPWFLIENPLPFRFFKGKANNIRK